MNLNDLAAARDVLAEEVAEHPRSHPLEQLGHAHRWLDEEAEAARCFRAAAADAERVHLRWRRKDPSGIARIGSLLWRAGELEAAEVWFARAAELENHNDRNALLSYLRGDDATAVAFASRAAAEDAEPYPLMDALTALATGRRDRNPAAAEVALDLFATLMRQGETTPDQESGSSNLATSGWLEESFAVRAAIAGQPRPDHRTMLAAVGLLRAEPGPPRPKPPPDVGPQGRGTLTLTYPHHSDGQVEPSVTIDDHGDLHFLLHPARDLRVVLRQTNGRWQAIVGDQVSPRTYRGPHSALQAADDLLRDDPDGQWAMTTLGKLFWDSFTI